MQKLNRFPHGERPIEAVYRQSHDRRARPQTNARVQMHENVSTTNQPWAHYLKWMTKELGSACCAKITAVTLIFQQDS